MNVEQVWELLLDYDIATEAELKLITNINGYNVDSLESVIYSRTGLNSVDQLVDELEIDQDE